MTAPLTTVGITWAEIGVYLESQGLKEGICRRGEDPSATTALTTGVDEMLVITRSVRAGWLTEERGVQWAQFQLRSVGAQNLYDSAETIAFQVDRILLKAQELAFVMMGDVRVSGVQDLGGGPTLLTIDRGGRSHFTASYAFAVPSGLQ